MDRVVVVGASLGGLKTAETLRRKGYEGSITLIGEEADTPYDRPPLSKQILTGEWNASQASLWKPANDEMDIHLWLGTRATAVDTEKKRVELTEGRVLDYDALVIATGARPRRLPDQPRLPGVHVLRTLEHALAIRHALRDAKRLVVVGGGFIGMEVAASARQRDVEVTVVEPEPVPCARGLGREIGKACAALHESHGVDLRLGLGVQAIEGNERVERVRLSNGRAIDCDLVVVGIGVQPNTEWLSTSGLGIDDGVLCDANGRASAKDVYALGDVARWEHPLFDGSVRVEHWTHTVEQATTVATTMMKGDDAKPLESAPLFWSDQYDIKIQGAGRPGEGDQLHVAHGSLSEGKFVALFGTEGRLTGVVGFQRPPKVMQYRLMIAKGASFDEAAKASEAG